MNFGDEINMPRLTKNVRQTLLNQNEGFEKSTHYSGKNFSVSNHYTIKNGDLYVRSTGKTSWADSRFDNEYIADEDQTRRFLKNNYSELNSDGIDEPEVDKRKEKKRFAEIEQFSDEKEIDYSHDEDNLFKNNDDYLVSTE
jgi:hypothetical protein